jgi:hypothetical protein
MLLAPPGWTCRALVAADGGTDIDVVARGDAIPSAGDPLPSSDQAVAEQVFPTCESCQLALACPFFADAAQRELSDYQQACPDAAPAGETDEHVSTAIMRFTDPAGTVGTGDPSGGADVAHGLIYYSGFQRGGSVTASVTCTLAPADAPLCDVILNDAQTRVTGG